MVGRTLCKSTDNAEHCDGQQTAKIDPRVESFPEGTEVVFEVERMAVMLESIPCRLSARNGSCVRRSDRAVIIASWSRVWR